jgi:hypothetical protein
MYKEDLAARVIQVNVLKYQAQKNEVELGRRMTEQEQREREHQERERELLNREEEHRRSVEDHRRSVEQSRISEHSRISEAELQRKMGSGREENGTVLQLVAQESKLLEDIEIHLGQTGETGNDNRDINGTPNNFNSMDQTDHQLHAPLRSSPVTSQPKVAQFRSRMSGQATANIQPMMSNQPMNRSNQPMNRSMNQSMNRSSPGMSQFSSPTQGMSTTNSPDEDNVNNDSDFANTGRRTVQFGSGTVKSGTDSVPVFERQFESVDQRQFNSVATVGPKAVPKIKSFSKEYAYDNEV